MILTLCLLSSSTCILRLRTITYFCWSARNVLRPSFVLAAVAGFVSFRTWRRVEVRKGFRIIDPFNQTESTFATVIDEALDLIRESSPIVFNRVKREIRVILNMPTLHAGAGYIRLYKTCKIDLPCFPIANERESAIPFLACALIHEATHGHLCRRRILQTGNNLLRAEKVCWKAEDRFARKIGFDLQKWDPFVPPPKRPTGSERWRFSIRQFKRMRKANHP
jgi:hypothetical protein